MAPRRYFSDSNIANAAYSTPRAVVASAERLNLTRGKDRVEKRPTSSWQTSAWQAYDSIGEVHYSFNMIGQLLSRVRLFPAVVENADQSPVHIDDYMKRIAEDSELSADVTNLVLEAAREVIDDLTRNAHGGVGNLLRLMGVNFGVAGEMYLVNHNGWRIASIDELTQTGNRWAYRRMRSARSGGKDGVGGEPIEKDAFVARLWREHPRFTGEPDSSMVGVLDDCELLILLQQAMRAMTRSRMNAGLMYIPDGIASFVVGGTTIGVEEAIARSSLESVEDETSQATVVPQILTGPPDLGEKIKWIPYGRQIDADFVALVDRTLERVLQGIDIPKDIVAGLASAKYANAVVITDELFKTHVEPMVLLCIDSLTSVYFRPMLKKKLNEMRNVPSETATKLIERMVIWADTSMVSTRPDRSQAANEGHDKLILSDAAWRDARGFSDNDAPEPEEYLRRVILKSGQVPPELVEAILKRIDPEWFEKSRAENTDIPPEIDALLKNATPPGEEPVAVPNDASSLTSQVNGAPINPNGAMPPQPAPIP